MFLCGLLRHLSRCFVFIFYPKGDGVRRKGRFTELKINRLHQNHDCSSLASVFFIFLSFLKDSNW